MHAVGLCANVLPGRNLAELRQSLLGTGAEIARLVGADPLPLGIWLSAETVRQLRETPGEAARLRDDLMRAGLLVAAVNAFPYGNFLGDRVKERVYEPHWADARRLLYTLAVAELLPDLVAPGTRHASVSTVPLGWRARFSAEGCGASVGLAAAQLEQAANAMARIEDRTGLRVTLDLEPEPGCAIQTLDELCGFMRHCLRGSEACRRHLGACVDLCHAAIMGESPRHAFAACADVGVHRVQVSAAIRGTGAQRATLTRWAEDRWLHQVVTGTAQEPCVWADIPDFLASGDRADWRCHFHVPVFLDRVGELETTAGSIPEAMEQVRRLADPCFVEVETYAWSRLPEVAAPSLAEGVAREVLHARALLARSAVSADA
jgi:sugar phosphate isomerase/epimerase